MHSLLVALYIQILCNIKFHCSTNQCLCHSPYFYLQNKSRRFEKATKRQVGSSRFTLQNLKEDWTEEFFKGIMSLSTVWACSYIRRLEVLHSFGKRGSTYVRKNEGYKHPNCSSFLYYEPSSSSELTARPWRIPPVLPNLSHSSSPTINFHSAKGRRFESRWTSGCWNWICCQYLAKYK